MVFTVISSPMHVGEAVKVSAIRGQDCWWLKARCKIDERRLPFAALCKFITELSLAINRSLAGQP
jgi:hypothetical protein